MEKGKNEKNHKTQTECIINIIINRLNKLADNLAGFKMQKEQDQTQTETRESYPVTPQGSQFRAKNSHTTKQTQRII
jgi:hypothetical protein